MIYCNIINLKYYSNIFLFFFFLQDLYNILYDAVKCRYRHIMTLRFVHLNNYFINSCKRATRVAVRYTVIRGSYV